MKIGLVLLLVFELETGILAGSPVYLGYQDSLGQYTFGYSGPESARSEIRSADGSTSGTFSYVDGAGRIQSAQYKADNEGFRIAATNLPQAPRPVQDTPEVTAARNEHLQLLALAEQMAQEEAEERADEIPQVQSRELMDPPKEDLVGQQNAEVMDKNEELMDDEMRQELIARTAQVVDFSQFSRAGYRPSGLTPAHTTLLRSEMSSAPVGKPAKISNKIAPADSGRAKNKPKNKKKSMQEELAALRVTPWPYQAPVYSPYNYVPFSAYPYNLGYFPYAYNSYFFV